MISSLREAARLLDGEVSGEQILCPGPGHSRRDRSLSVRVSWTDGFIVHSFTGDDWRLCRDHVRERLGLCRETLARRPKEARRRPPSPQPVDDDHEEKTASALALWRGSLDPRGTPVETYLRSRGLGMLTSAALRFHAGLRHPTAGIWPVMVALVTNGADGRPIAIHRTFLARDGAAKAPVDPQKMMFGPCCGGAVRLADPSDVLMVGEGIETCLAAMLASGHPAWAALSTSGMHSLDLPNDVRDVIVLADGDEAGEAAARDCASRWKREGKRVRIARPPHGFDFNDLLLGRASRIERGAL